MTLEDSTTSRAGSRLRVIRKLLAVGATIFLTIYFIRAIDANRGVRLEPWHSVRLEQEYRAGRAANLDEYRAREDDLFAELDARIAEWNALDRGHLRYESDSRSDPRTFEFDGNRSYELPVPSPSGVAVLVHGLTDSPYSLRRIGETLRDANLHVVSPRLPGHGTAPGELLDVTWRDWKAVVRLAAEHARELAGDELPIFLVGYSLGGALVVDYTLDALNENEGPLPHRLVLLSPAIRVTSFASFAHLHAAVSWLPIFEAFRWQSMGPEFDPFKYVSFPKNGATQMRAVTLAIEDGIAALSSSGRASEFPPMLVFQSIVDTTVSSESVLSDLMKPLAAAESELVVYDVNRDARLHAFIDAQDVDWLEDWTQDSARAFRLTVISNDPEVPERVIAVTREAEETEAVVERLDAAWPPDVYSLSHVALPFAPDDPVNGRMRNGNEVNLGGLAPRGERDLLRISINDLMRLRHNPFFDDLSRRVVESLK